jgi:anti-sigma B factor antagonist
METDVMNFTHNQQGQAALFALEGSLLGERDRVDLKNQFMDYIEKGVSHFLIDLSQLKHINSTGLGVFITLYTKVRAKQGEMVLVNPSENIVNLLTITKLTSVFAIVDTPEQGMARLGLA